MNKYLTVWYGESNKDEFQTISVSNTWKNYTDMVKQRKKTTYTWEIGQPSKHHRHESLVWIHYVLLHWFYLIYQNITKAK